ncbi:MAG: MFS transporter [Eubacteriales bacterium]
MLKQFTKEEKSWMMYDWANSAHSIVVVTVLPIFFMALFDNNANAVGWWGYVTSASKLVIAILAPLLGTIGDYKNMKKRMLKFFVAIGALSCVAMAGVPFKPIWQLVLALYALSLFGFAGANIYYDGLLTDVTTKDRMDKVSSWGFGLGYIGGSTIPFVIFLVLYMLIDANIAMSISFALTGIWWGVFTIPLLKNVEQKHFVERKGSAVKQTFQQIWKTFIEIIKFKPLLWFLLAYFFYIDGVNTIIYMSTVYGSSLGIDSTQMMLALLMVQVLAFPFAILYSYLAKKTSAARMIFVGIMVYVGICIFAFFVTDAWHFWVVAFLVSTSQGGIQALSRSQFGRMIPDPKRSNEFFGFYEIFAKFSAIIGPALFGGISLFAFNKIRVNNPELTDVVVSKMATPYGVLSVLLVFALGIIFYIAFLRSAKKHSVA